jgi:hypothetical protein
MSEQIERQRASGAVRTDLSKASDAALESGQPDDVGGADFKTWKAVVFMRVSASDAGYLSKICVPEGELRKVGELVAVLATEPNETAGETENALGEASVFRAVANMVRLEEGE